jgi:hypothetical protein
MKRAIFLLLFSLGLFQLKAQESEALSPRYISARIDINGDTIPLVWLRPYYHFERRTFKNKAEARKYSRLEKNVRVVYPYAKLAGELLNKYQAELSDVDDPKKVKRYYKKVEEELRAQYEGELMELTVTQGRILIKLIDRETRHTSYDLVKNLRNGVTAFLYQGIARLFGHDLKSEYNASEEDKYIEEIVLALEHNQI